jgi:hypothetical protein
MQQIFERQLYRAENRSFRDSFVGQPSTCQEISRNIALWLAFFREFTGASSAGARAGSLDQEHQ